MTDFKQSEYVFEGERVNLPDQTDKISDREMREFLVQRILQLKMHTFGKRTEEMNSERYKFKASTLYNLQPSHMRKKYVKALTGEEISVTCMTTQHPLSTNISMRDKSKIFSADNS